MSENGRGWKREEGGGPERKGRRPFALVETFGWTTVFDVLLLSYIFFGIEEIGVEIEGPFGYDPNDLPLEDICETIHRNLYALTGLDRPAPAALEQKH